MSAGESGENTSQGVRFEVAKKEMVPSSTAPSILDSKVGIKKDIREILHQLALASEGPTAKEMLKKHGYDEKAITEELEKKRMDSRDKVITEDVIYPNREKGSYVSNIPSDYSNFLNRLRQEVKNKEHGGTRISSRGEAEAFKGVNDFFKDFNNSHPLDEKLLKDRLKEMEANTYVLGSTENSPELQRSIREFFPSGNYIIHAALLESALAILNSGDLKSVGAIKQEDPEFKGHAGEYGISFNMNKITVLPITYRHGVMFLISPESALSDKTKLTVPYTAAENEIQLVDKTYDRRRIAEFEVSEAFVGFYERNYGEDGRGVKSNFSKLEKYLRDNQTESNMIKDLNDLKSGNISIEQIRKLYRVENGRLYVDPSFPEQNIVGGTIFADYLLNHTEEGKKLGKQLNEVDLNELVNLYNSVQSINIEGKPTGINRDLHYYHWINNKDKTNSGMNSSVSIPIEQLIMVIPSNDKEKWLQAIARSNRRPKAVVVFSGLNGPRVIHWEKPEGHKDKATNVIESFLSEVDVPFPSLPYTRILNKEDITSDDINAVGSNIEHLKWKAIVNAQDIVKGDENKLLLI